jgi:cytochrome P450
VRNISLILVQTTGVIAIAILALVLYPDVQKKAQEEIDKVIGPHRLPDFEDRHSLPFVEALYREVLRWHPLAPFGMSSRVLPSTVMSTVYFVAGGIHATSAEDVYEGMYIPKSKHLLWC